MRKLFMRMAERSGIEHRWSVLPPAPGGLPHNQPRRLLSWRLAGHLDAHAASMPRRRRSSRSRRSPGCGEQVELDGITHLVVASCTGFVAPGIDQIIARRLGLDDVERTLVGFMGCYAAVSALRTAYHIVRSEPDGAGAGGDGRAVLAPSPADPGARAAARHAPVQRRRGRGFGHRRAGRLRDEPSLLGASSRIRPS